MRGLSPVRIDGLSQAIVLLWSILPVYGVRVSVAFYLMFVHNNFCSAWAAVLTPFGKKLLTRLAVFSHCVLAICNLSYFTVWFRGLG